MPDRVRAGRFLRSLLTVDVVLRLSAVVLAVLIVVRALFAGADGFWAIVYVAASAVALWASVRLFGRVRVLLAQAGADGPEGTTASQVASWLAGRSRSRLIAVLALLILIVHAALTGYVGVWTILVAVAMAAIATLLSPDLRLVALLGGTAVVFAFATVFAANMFQGSTEARALAVSLAAVVLPVLVSDKLVRLVRQPQLTITHHAILAVLTLLLGFLGFTRAEWLPGVVHNCYTLPTSTGITVLRATADGTRCYGLLDTADPGVFAAAAFGRDKVTTDLQRAILAKNKPLADGDLTVVWLGALSCEPAPADATRCADGRDYPSERDQLRALLLAQQRFTDLGGHKLHVVIADATQDVARADDVAALIVERRAALGPRAVVIGGGDSRDTTQLAINRLLDAHIPFIAPNLLADLGVPGKPFVDRAGYLQLAPPNLEYAQDTMGRLRKIYTKGFRLDVYQLPNPTDQYTTSLVNDLFTAARKPMGETVRRVSSLDRIDATACDGAGDGPPTVLFFADRWTRFAEFAQRINDLCGHDGPRLVVADGSVSRFMANYQLRAVSNSDWPVNYYVSGPGCAELSGAAFTTISDLVVRKGMAGPGPFTCADREAAAGTTPGAVAGELRGACTLDAAVKLKSQPCEPNDLGTFLIPAWDAVMLADALLPARPPAGRDYLTSLNVTGVELATGVRADVVDGRLKKATISRTMWHVDPLYDPTTIYERPSAVLTPPTGRPATPSTIS